MSIVFPASRMQMQLSVSGQIPYVLQFVANRISIVANVLSVRYSNRKLRVTLHARCSYIWKACPPQQNKIARRSLLSFDHRQVRFWFKSSSEWVQFFPASFLSLALTVTSTNGKWWKDRRLSILTGPAWRTKVWFQMRTYRVAVRNDHQVTKICTMMSTCFSSRFGLSVRTTSRSAHVYVRFAKKWSGQPPDCLLRPWATMCMSACGWHARGNEDPTRWE